MTTTPKSPSQKTPSSDPTSDSQYVDKLSPEQFAICRGKGTERAFSGKYWDTKTAGVYHCACCGESLFSSQTKYDSGSGWPSFYAPLDASKVAEETDVSLGMRRTEIHCAHCDSHLGHVFPDGPAPTGLRYCVNSASLDLHADEDGQA